MSTSIWVTTQFRGFHCWPTAPDEVGYLRSLHRHVFNVKVHVAVSHDDRDVEFHLFQKQLEKIIAEQLIGSEDHSLSCEGMARIIMHELQKQDVRVSQVEVDEDGECGAIITR